MIKIVYAANDKMFDCIYLSVLSILRRTKQNVSFYLLSADFVEIKPKYTIMSNKHVDILSKLVKSYGKNNSFKLVNCREEYDKCLKGNKNEKSHYSPYAGLRLLIDRYPYINGKVIYLDADTMAAGDVNEFMKIDLADNEFAVCHDCLGRYWQYKDCFNSGVMLFNLDLCRKNQLFEKARGFMYKKLMYFPDQSALNLAVTKFMFFPGNEYRFNQQKIKIMPDTVIKHFCARIKWWPLHNNVKQWDVKNVHRYLHIHAFDEDFAIYLKMKELEK